VDFADNKKEAMDDDTWARIKVFSIEAKRIQLAKDSLSWSGQNESHGVRNKPDGEISKIAYVRQ